MRVLGIVFVAVGVLSLPICAATPAEPYKVFFGNLHAHSSYSDGSGTPAEAFTFARDTGKLDFMALSEHNHASAEMGAKERRDGLMIATQEDLYNGDGENYVTSAARRATEDGRFVALAGQEFSAISKGNHINVFEIKPVIKTENGAFDQLFRFLAATPDSLGEPALVMLNHPGDFKGPEEYGEDDCPDRKTWIATLNKYAALIEVLSGPAMAKTKKRPTGNAQRDYFHYLSLGLYLAPTASQDNHYKTWGTATDTRTGVLAKSLTKADILNALKARRAYATHDKNLRVWFRVGGNLMGDIVKAGADLKAVNATVTIEDGDEPQAHYKIELLRGVVGGGDDTAVVTQRELVGDGSVRFENVRYRGGRSYYLVRIAQSSGRGPKDMTWTAPVWIEP